MVETALKGKKKKEKKIETQDPTQAMRLILLAKTSVKKTTSKILIVMGKQVLHLSNSY